jgi:hypothetical protein
MMATPEFRVGDFVRLREPIRIGSGLTAYHGQRGEVTRILRRTKRSRPIVTVVTVAFTRELPSGFLARVYIHLKPGDIVKDGDQ